MFTIKPLGTAQEAGHYYMDQDNYYLTEQETLENMTSWGGKGAEKLGLKGAVEKEQFLSLLEGRLPSGQVLGIVREKDKREHRTGTDVTLSAPKSVSLLALTGNDERLLKAHKKAVQITLERIEKMASEARKTVNGKVEFEKTDNLTVAMFQHTTSRELDENLHTHLVILNMTQRKDGLWRALSSKGKTDKDNLYNGFRQILYDNQHFFGLVYMSTLAKEVKALGFDIDIKDQYGNFEISGVSKEYIERSSKRRTQILEHLEEREVSGARAAEIANLDSREAKQHIDSDSLKSYWDEKAGSDKEKICELINKSKERGESGTTQTELTPISNTIIEALDDALEHLSQYNGKITHADLVQYAFIFAVGKIEHTEIEQEISNRLSNKSLLGKQDEFYTTKSLLSKERQFASSISNAA